MAQQIDAQTAANEVTKTAKAKAAQFKDSAERVEARVSDRAMEISENLSDRAQRLAEQFQDLSQQLMTRAEEMRDRTSETVSRHPFYSVGAAALVGLSVGFVLSKMGSSSKR